MSKMVHRAKFTKSRKTCLLPASLAKSICLTPRHRTSKYEQRVRANVEGRECNIYVNFAVEPGQKLHVLLRPEDLRVEEINDDNHAEGLIGYVRERNYKGMTLESVVELENGKMVMVSEFFNEDDPDFDHSLDQKMAINWVESWEVVLADEEHK